MSDRSGPRRYVLLDRDGTIILDRGYLADPEGVELIVGAAEGLRHLARIGLGLIVVTNQSGVGRGLIDDDALSLVHRRLTRLLDEQSVRLDGIYSCLHGPAEGCACRKPGTALVERAAAELGFDPQASFTVGDKASDVELGRAIGATTLLVRTGDGAGVEAEGGCRPDFVADDLRDAARIIQGQL